MLKVFLKRFKNGKKKRYCADRELPQNGSHSNLPNNIYGNPSLS